MKTKQRMLFDEITHLITSLVASLSFCFGLSFCFPSTGGFWWSTIVSTLIVFNSIRRQVKKETVNICSHETASTVFGVGMHIGHRVLAYQRYTNNNLESFPSALETGLHISSIAIPSLIGFHRYCSSSAQANRLSILHHVHQSTNLEIHDPDDSGSEVNINQVSRPSPSLSRQ
jgi:hypothetical protein